MILELDVGNTNIKWRLLTNSGNINASFIGNAQVIEKILQHVNNLNETIEKCRFVSVKKTAFNVNLVEQILKNFNVTPWQFFSVASCAGVKNGYKEPEKLGADRFLAVIAAFNKFKEACLVVDVGSAITVDFVNSKGEHLGGLITPSFEMMYLSLVEKTDLIKESILGKEYNSDMYGTDTKSAIKKGLNKMIEIYTEKCFTEARSINPDTKLIVTGGNCELFCKNKELIIIKDLVLDGLKYVNGN